MQTRSRALLLASIAASLVAFGPDAVPAHAAGSCTVAHATGTTIDRPPFLENALGIRWNLPTDRLAFTYQSASGFYRIATTRPDGLDRREFPAALANVPHGHRGSPYWDPSGRYIIFTAQKDSWSGRKLFGSPDYEALPGFGRHDDLWIATADGAHLWQLTSEPDTPDEGILIPVFSPDGVHVAWSERRPGGTYVLRVAELIEGSRPRLGAIRDYRPGGKAYYETGSFTSDGGGLLYTSDQDTHSFARSQIYRLDLATGSSTRLTPGTDYNEHPTDVPSGDGDRIVYMSTLGVQRFPLHFLPGTDWYAMDLKGNGRVRLTTMNLRTAGNSENFGSPRFAGTVAVSPAGDYFLGDVQDSIATQHGLSLKVRFVCP